MEDARYRARFYEGLENAASAVNLVSGSAGDVLVTYIVKHPCVELCLLGCDFETAVTGPITPGNEAVLGVYRQPAGGGAEVDTTVRFSVPLDGVLARTAPSPTDGNIETDINKPLNRPKFFRGDRLRIKLVEPGVTTAQAGRPWVSLREVKHGPQEGPS